MVLLLITDGVLNDMAATVDAVVAASCEGARAPPRVCPRGR